MDSVMVAEVVSFLVGVVFGIAVPKMIKGISSEPTLPEESPEEAPVELPEESPAEMPEEPPTTLAFSKHFFAEDQGGDDGWRWFIFKLKGRESGNSASYVFKVDSRENAIALMAHLDRVEDEREPC